ncbi:cation diffusion facilitator family transporter [Hymenobacter sp. M29]|uniref:Cation diffusion facilitator family transporter n=1 Tax=Hymenobacter mellowenesis TaxID=3063995 RepID=A0ABT9AIK9_9BACT|nr:cation diffusion facilitator family transporter [Hymenobacter sp. M29]MDO7849700.1 cation diffusion facilitator family transporter [Hymenobacter sp. M29]
MTHEETAVKATYFSIIGNTALALLKGVAGYFGNSYALVADAIESTADIFSSFLVLLGIKYANRPADANHPYGHGRIEPLVTFLVVGFLMASATLIGYESIQNIGTPHALPKAWTLLVLGGIIAWKELSFRTVMRKAEETNSSSLKADAWHHRSDAITSVAAFVGISFALLMGPGYEAADDWAALFAAGLIIYNSYRIFRPALGEILDENVHDDLVADIRRVALTVAGVRGTEKCFVRKAGMQYHVDLHALVSGDISVRDGHEIAHRLQDRLREQLPQLGHVLIHVEPQE